MKNIKWREVTFNALIILVLLLLALNSFLYSKFKKMESNTNYISRLSSAIAIAANSNDMVFLTPELLPEDQDYLIDTFETIKPAIGRQYSIKNYIAIEYANGNILMIKVTRNREGEFLIQDMFLLDEDIYEKLKRM
ncbi:hypothetical protein [Brassicibacter mesophilus]|uniref:hypothetical protein n=1 Tax=Brassicibacter mesophilus TaxID=745119 RepID=UPI003D1C3C7A